MTPLDRSAFLGVAAVLPRVAVEVPDLGGSAYVRTMTAGDRDQFELSTYADPRRDVRARLLAFTVCAEDGSLIFTPADLGLISALPVTTVQPLFAAALKLNQFTKDDVDELEKN